MIRTLYKSDLDEILPIEQAVHVLPWTEETFKLCFNAGYIGWVIEVDHKIIGFIMVSLSADECHVLNLCVARSHQRQSFGRTLLLKALEHAQHLGISIAYLEVRRSNQAAIALYKKLQFLFIGERKNYYPVVSGYEDALIFAKNLQIDE
jgi:ribosomal-protein-alanine N-acetyltransferase